tara:strand:+ start:455 stop:1462 length:1008 start_codon:yes stop_codon:yes gene_type:complete
MKIAIVKLSALGDIVHAMIVLQFIKNYYQEIKIDWVVEESYKELLEDHPDINKVHVVNIKKAKSKKSFFLLLKQLKSVREFGSYDLVIDLQGLIKSAIISRLISSPVTVGFDKLSTREGLASIFYNRTFNYGYAENVIERNLALISFALGVSNKKEEIFNKKPFLFTNHNYFIDNFSNTKKNILLIPGASNISKRYPIEKLAELTTILDANFFVTWGNLNEKILANEIKTLSPQVKVCNQLSIKALISLIKNIDLVIGPDTGPTHMAWALNIPSITLFGSTPGYRNTCITNINKTIESDSQVNPKNINKNDYSIKNIKVSDISNLAYDLLEIIKK